MHYLDFDAIKREISLKMVLDRLGWRPVGSRGDQQRGPCLLHASKSGRSRSFAVKGNGWYCHKCKIYGDQIALWAVYKNMSSYDAAIDLCTQFNVPIYHLPRFGRVFKSGNGEEERLSPA